MVDVCSLGAGLALAPALARPCIRLAGGPVIGAFGLGTVVPAVLLVGLRGPAEPPLPSGPPPAVVADARADGRATIVEFIDFECPFCRRQHARMSEVLETLAAADERPPVYVVYKHLPLEMHAHAREAARFVCCAEEQGRGREMVDALFARDELSPAACRECASEVGLDDAALQECLDSARPDARLDADAADARAAGIRRLPTCFVGERRFEGLQEEDTLRRAIEHAMTQAIAPT
jgi:protein-disulfide isomerase